jgi:hypothetical protein
MRRTLITLCLSCSLGLLFSQISFPGKPLIAIGCPDCTAQLGNTVGLFASVPENPENRAIVARNELESDQADWATLRRQVTAYQDTIPPTPAQSMGILVLSLAFLVVAAGGNVYFFARAQSNNRSAT